MVQWLIALVLLKEGPFSVTSTYMVTPVICNANFRGSITLFWRLSTSDLHVVHRHSQVKHTYKIKYATQTETGWENDLVALSLST